MGSKLGYDVTASSTAAPVEHREPVDVLGGFDQQQHQVSYTISVLRQPG
jgi:hypothetical protein